MEIVESPSEGELKGKQLCGLSVWKCIEDAERFVVSGKHGEVYRRRGEWCSSGEKNCVLWWEKKGEKVSLESGMKRLERLRLRGATSFAFNFERRFAPPEDSGRDILKLALSLVFFLVIIVYVLLYQN